MVKKSCQVEYHFFKGDKKSVFAELSKESALAILDEMLLIRNFEQRGEQSYQMGKVWGFYHAYTGQEAIQTAAVHALGGKDRNLWATTYRCHALALLLGMTAKEGMCELYGKANGNAQGRGGSMHFYTKNMFGGFGIVGGQWPIGAGLAFSLKYRGVDDQIAICFGGDGSVMQGPFHETANMAKLWNLPYMVVIENNQIGMGTQIQRAVAQLPLGENVAKAYGIKSFTFNGMDFVDSYATFKEAYRYMMETREPVILEAVCYRFRGHSISDAAHYRSKEELEEAMKQDPIQIYLGYLKELHYITDEEFDERNRVKKDLVLEAMKFADASPDPDPITLEEGVMAK